MRLGTTQEEVLRCLREHGFWHQECGWLWDTYSGTTRLLRTLVKRGLVREMVRNGRPYFEPKS